MRAADGITPAHARAAFLRACRLDVETAKPGNVSVESAGHGMTSAQFIESATVAADALFSRGAAIGPRILDAVTLTRARVACNTNLGIVLLVAPLAAALESTPAPRDAAAWQRATEAALAALDIDDARAAYRAIALANPGGLGDAPEQTVHAEPTVSLREAMALAAARDSIARQYAEGFRDVFEIHDAAAHEWPRETRPGVVTLDVYLTYLSRWPDSHIVRKHGETVAQSVTREAQRQHAQWRIARDKTRGAEDGIAANALARWDAELKARGINPGTSADLTVATLFVAGVLDDVGPVAGA
ncbi:triphosphoribosyl-dephospho-CoA synthase [Paraburkholderia sartisoli]|uniref:Triphosphoribosyl-dephospho-CoA synthase n=1 Tax=Paraburkholderia sartisoli TaxID=83784 RepID=A0A1H4A846_9BURK|nr:triphosphoribosyl-dephospho-CoA synthase [Paraburkholderia sartisoli]SEA32155.1 triphosphoribosyl-dephospho-CoA synthase [Paraburkholderia sartisoli]